MSATITGFLTDSTLCIGCKACEVACKEWNGVEADGFNWSGNSYDNTGAVGHSTWRHVKFVEGDLEPGFGGNATDHLSWEFSSDVCKHCENAGCLEACPTGAIVEPYRIDATRCISYLTIENRGDIAQELQQKMGDWIYGCDVCQDVCPWNRRAAATLDPRLAPRIETGAIDLKELESWSAEDYQRRLSHSAMKRVKLPVLQRNGRIAAQNAK